VLGIVADAKTLETEAMALETKAIALSRDARSLRWKAMRLVAEEHRITVDLAKKAADATYSSASSVWETATIQATMNHIVSGLSYLTQMHSCIKNTKPDSLELDPQRIGPEIHPDRSPARVFAKLGQAGVLDLNKWKVDFTSDLNVTHSSATVVQLVNHNSRQTFKNFTSISIINSGRRKSLHEHEKDHLSNP
jgi:hypothetical protein